MSSFIQQCNPRANVFLLVNLGCEMLYVIHERLRDQKISEKDSAQVIHDITVVLLDPKYIDSLILGSTHSNSQLLTEDHCKFMLYDIATSSIMRLEKASMDKLWNLMTMVYKWQIFVSKYPQHLLDITFRHMNGISHLYPDSKRSMLVNFTKNTLLDFWNAIGDEGQSSIYRTTKAWLQGFNTKISLLMRLSFQTLDGNFVRAVETSYFNEFVETIGENVYAKSREIATQQHDSEASSSSRQRVNQLADLLNFQQSDSEELKPIDASNFQKQFEQNLQQCNILFEDLDVNGLKPKTSSDVGELNMGTMPDSSSQRSQGEFVRLEPVYSRNAAASSTGGGGLNQELLDLYSKIK